MTDEELYLRLVEKYALRVLADAASGKGTYLAHCVRGDPGFENLYALSKYTQRLPQAIKDAYPRVEWKHVEVIQYALDQPLGFDHNWLWNVVQQDVPQIKHAAAAALAAL